MFFIGFLLFKKNTFTNYPTDRAYKQIIISFVFPNFKFRSTLYGQQCFFYYFAIKNRQKAIINTYNERPESDINKMP